jgi:hypothetical protein
VADSAAIYPCDGDHHLAVVDKVNVAYPPGQEAAGNITPESSRAEEEALEVGEAIRVH